MYLARFAHACPTRPPTLQTSRLRLGEPPGRPTLRVRVDPIVFVICDTDGMEGRTE